MKKAAFAILFCMGSMLLVHPAQAEKPGFSGELVIGGVITTGRLSQLEAEDDNSRVNQLGQQSHHDTYGSPYICGDLNYTLKNGQTTFFISDMHSDLGLAVGVRRSMGESGQISIASTFNRREVWQDPYLVGLPRSRTHENSYGLSLQFEDILGTNFLVDTTIATVDVDKDRIGDREKSLRRDGYRSNLTLGYVIGLSENLLITPTVSYTRNDMDGDANSSDDVTLAVGYEWGSGSWAMEASAGVGWTKYRKTHPVYSKEREATSYEASALLAYIEPFGWSQAFIYGLAAYSRVDENIDFFDQDLWTYSVGVGFEF